MTLTAAEFGDLVMYAARYALGRMTYAPVDVTEVALAHLADLTPGDARTLLKDIETHAARDRSFGTAAHRERWLRLRDALKARLDAEESS